MGLPRLFSHFGLESEQETRSDCLFLFDYFSGKKAKKKGKTLTLTDFLAEDSGGGGGGGGGNVAPSYSNKSTSWADETDDLDGDGEHRIRCYFHQFDSYCCLKHHNIHYLFFFLCVLSSVSTSWHSEEDNFRAPPIDRSILPTAPRSAREPNIDMSRLPRNPPYTAFLGNLPYDVTEDSIKDFFRGLAVGSSSKPLTTAAWRINLF